METQIRTAAIDVDLTLKSDSPVGSRSPSRLQLENTTLQRELEDKKREIDRLHAVIEAISPIPGYDYDKVSRMMGKNDDVDMDHRDSKIVSLAKKSRNLTVQLNKISAENESLRQSIRELNVVCNNLREEVALAQNGKFTSGSSDTNIESVSKELLSANKTIEDLRRKYTQVKEDLKNHRVALAREIGEGVTIEQALEGGNWRGRAQTIVMLKSKIRRLEQNQQEAQSKSNASADNVDAKADRVIAEMDHERRQAIEIITEDLKRLTTQHSELESKFSSSKARIKILETDNQKLKQQIQVVLDKTTSDDELIEAFKAEIERLKATIRDNRATAKSLETQADAKRVKFSQTGKEEKGGLPDDLTRRYTNEISRLERICKSQSQQLSTQDTVIRELRAQLS